MAKKNEVAKVEESQVPAVNASDYGEDVGAGFEDMTSDEMVIARISILQKMSPAVDSDNQAYIEDAKPGKLVNSVTGELYDKDEGFRFIPVHRVHEFLEFVPRDLGGGFKGAHAPESDVVAEARARVGGNWGKIKSAEGNNLIETFQVYGLLVDEEGGYQVAQLSFSSSNIKTFKRWMTMARAVTLRTDDGRRITLPLFAHVYRVNTQYMENAKGSWYAYNVGWAEGNAEESRLAPEDELYQAAKLTRDMVLSGAAQARYNEGGEGKDEVEDVDVF